VFENRVLRRICGPNRDGVIEAWRRLHNEELYDLYSTMYYSADQIKKNVMGGEYSTYGGEQKCVQDFGGET
jgi:hypothetical protein